MKKIKPKSKKNSNIVLEYTVGVIIAFVIVIGVLGYFINSSFGDLSILDNSASQDILGVETENSGLGVNQIIINPNSLDDDGDLIITSGYRTSKIILFDNENREYLEGFTSPNAKIELQLDDEILSSESNPNGFFTLKIPKETAQFSQGRITIFDMDFQIKESFKFVFVLRSFFNRSYFVLEGRDEIFSLQLKVNGLNHNFYTSKYGEFDKVENQNCIATLDPKVNQRDYNILEDLDVVITPDTIESLDFLENKFVAFRMINNNSTYTLDYCKNEWRQFNNTLKWHTEEVNDIFEESFEFNFGEVQSDPIDNEEEANEEST